MAVTDLTNTKWLFNNYISCERIAQDGPYNLNFTSNNSTYTILKGQLGFNYDLYYDNTAAYLNTKDGASWTNEAYKTIEIIGGRDVSDDILISWLESNATQILSTVDIVLGSNTLSGVDTIKVVDANNTSAYVDFVYGTTPSTTTSIKIGDSTLTGVNTISVLGADSNQKTFGYKPSAFSVAITLNNSGDLSYGMVDIYDGQDNTGTLLYSSGQGISSTITTNVQCSTGYLYIVGTANGDPQDSIALNTSLSNNVTIINERDGSTFRGTYQITGNATLVANCYYCE